jgi:asparagine synthase (glutamine-hydrolysing)
LKLSPIFASDLNLQQISRSIQLGWICFKNETNYSKVSILEAGYNLFFKNDSIEINQYWDVNSKIMLPKKESEYVDEFKNLFDNSLMLHLRSDVPIGTTLSGGIDSSAIVCSILNKKHIKNLSAFSVYYEGDKSVDERPFIYEIEKKYTNQFNSFYTSPSENEIAEHFHNATFHNDFPLLGSSPLSQYFVMKLIAENGIKVVLSGQGADDYLGGYMHSYYRLYAEYLKSFKIGKIFNEFKKQKSNQEFGFSKSIDIALKSFLSLIFSENKLYQLEFEKYLPNAINIKKNNLNLSNLDFNKFNAFHYQLIKSTSLPSLLHYEDRNSMAFSIESRVPFLDHRLVEFAFNTPTELKIKNGYTKWILREAMKNRLPEKIRYRTDKKGFVTPGEVIWLRGSLKHLLEIDYQKLEFLNKKIVAKEVEEFKKGNDKNANFVWRIASLNYWMKHFN